jgi:tetratricopeptide (TPR) repeat protein
MHREEMEAYKQAIQLKPDFADAHYNLGISFDLMGDGDNAIRHILRSEQLYRKKRQHRNIRKTQRYLRLLYQKYNARPEDFN